MNKKVWLITGISSGLGKALIEAVVESGQFAIGTFRRQDQVDSFNARYDGKAFAVKVDMTKTHEVDKAVKFIETKFKRIDVLVNNAGVGFAGAIEESSMIEVREIFEVNFFGTLQFTKSLLPLMRSQGTGHIIQISSHGGVKAFPGFGVYNATKFALEGFSEALATELVPLGIKVIIVEPGPLRTNFAGNSFREASVTIPAYDATAGEFRKRMKNIDGKQEGDPQKAALAIIDIVTSPKPPLRLPLGKIALNTINAKLESVRIDMEAYRRIAEHVVYP